jgi:phosphonate transport system ATP-binding protein
MIEIDKLSIAYPQTGAVVSSVSMSIRRGEFLVLLGRSGAGKSSLLRSINYLVRPSAGAIMVADLGLLGSKRSLRAHRRRTAMVFQQHQLILRLTALDNVLLGCLGRYSTWRSLLPWRRADVALAYECLERVGLGDRALYRADELSGGERQRVGIARALAQQPQLLLVDEPVASLDPRTADLILTLLSEICLSGGLTAVVSLHQLDLARRYADRIVALAGGRMAFDGGPAELTDDDLRRIYGGAPRDEDEIHSASVAR